MRRLRYNITDWPASGPRISLVRTPESDWLTDWLRVDVASSQLRLHPGPRSTSHWHQSDLTRLLSDTETTLKIIITLDIDYLWHPNTMIIPYDLYLQFYVRIIWKSIFSYICCLLLWRDAILLFIVRALSALHLFYVKTDQASINGKQTSFIININILLYN